MREKNVGVSKYSPDYKKPPILEGYKYVYGRWFNGLVIECESDGSQFVWIPVSNLEPNGTLDGESFDERFGRRICDEEIVELAKSMKRRDSVKSHLVYGAEFDTTIEWLLECGQLCRTDILEDSANWCNRELQYTKLTGKSDYDDYPYPSCLILGYSINNEILHILCGMSEDTVHMITVYYPNTEKWQEDMKTRRER